METGVSKKEREFIDTLAKSLYHTSPVYSEVYGHGIIEHYSDKHLTKWDVNKILSIWEKSDWLFYPRNTCSGFAVGYRMADINLIAPGIPPELSPVLTFIHGQLPKSVDFDYLAEYFMRPLNLERANMCDIEVVDSYGHYDY